MGAGQLDQKRSAELRGDDSRLGPHDDAGEPQHYGVCQVNSRHRDPAAVHSGPASSHTRSLRSDRYANTGVGTAVYAYKSGERAR